MGPTRRRLVIAGSLAAPVVARAQRPAAITIAAPGGVFEQVFQTAVIDPFRRQRPEIAVYYYAVSNPAQTLSLLRQRMEPAQFDVVILSPRIGRSATRDGLLDPLTADGVPAREELVPAAQVADMAGCIAMVDCLAMPHVPAVSRPDMASWRLLWDDRTRRIAIPAAPEPVGIALTMIASRLFGQGDDQQSLAGGITALRHIAPRVVSWHPRPDVFDYLIDDLAAFGIGWNSIGQVRARRNTERLRMALPRDVTFRDAHTIHLVKGSARAEAARSFVNHVLGAEAQSRLAESLCMTPVNPRARISAEASTRLLPLEDPSRPILTVDSPEIDALRSRIVDGWRSQVLRPR